MTVRILDITPKLYDYILSVSLRETPLMKRLREETALLPRAGWQIPPHQGQFMAFLVKLIRARRCLEIGTFTGYSACAVALASLPEKIRGFGHVKLRAIEVAKTDEAALLARFRSAPAPAAPPVKIAAE